MSQRKTSMAPPPNSNLYCTSCDSQIGIFENEWTHLTTSYASPQEKGTHFGTEVGVKTQIVPVGSAQKDAEGCEMSEVFCTKCSSVVAQYCRTAPEPSQQRFVGQYFYKLSRVYLKDSHTSLGVEMKFTDGNGAQSQRATNSVPSSTAPRQRIPSGRAASDVPFRQSFPPPSGQSWQWPPTQGYFKPIAPNDFRSASAQPMLDYRHDQLAPLTECANRITATDMRLANQEMRFNTSQEKFHDLEVRVDNNVTRLDRLVTKFECMETKMDVVKGECAILVTNIKPYITESKNKFASQQEKLALMDEDLTQLESDFDNRNDAVKEQQRKIEEQDQELRRVTAKLEELENIVDGLKATINENRAQHSPIPHIAPYSPPKDFPESHEVMTKALKSTQSESDELKVLRDENRAMKTRLRTIAGAMGFEAENESNTDNDENVVLGKRKRAAGYDTVRQRKMSRHPNDIPADLVHSGSALPTPDSSQNRTTLLPNTQNRDETGTEREMDFAEADVDVAKTVEVLDESVIQIDNEEMMEQSEDGESILREKEVVANVTSPLPGTPELVAYAHTTPINVSSNQSKAIFTQQADCLHANSENTVHSDHTGENRAFSSKAIQPTNPMSVATKILQPRPSMIARASFGSSGPVSMIERMRSPSVRNSPAPLPFSAQSYLPKSQIDMATHRVSQPGQERGSDFRRPETFSGALSRGETLEHIVHRSQPGHSPHVNSISQQRIAPMQQQHHSQNKSAEVQSQVLQPTQDSRLNTPNAAALSSNLVKSSHVLPVAESVEFSDEENEPSNSRQDVHHETASKTPTGEQQKVGPTLISRTIAGLTFEPLVRPVIEDENHDNSRAGSRRQSTSVVPISGAAPIMPEILAAIKNLNDCVVSQPAKPVFSTPGPRSTRTKAPVKNSKKIRKSEPIARSLTRNLTNNDCPQSSTTITRSKSSANDSVDKINTLVMISRISGTVEAPPLSDTSSHSASKTIVNKSNSALPTQHEAASRGETSEAETRIEQESKRVNSTRKSLTRQQLLKERNRLAMEAMEREEAGQRSGKVTV